jgi:creatinine amidohydrolase
MTRTVLLEEMTWPQVQRAIQQGTRSVIIPLGATEQHGPGLPLCTDTLHAAETARRAAVELGEVLVAPTISLGYSPEHVAFAGTLTLKHETLLAVLRDVVDSLARSGFTFIYFWLGHGGDTPVVKHLVEDLQKKPVSARVAMPDVAQYVHDVWDTVPLAESVDLAVSGSHAGEFEASLVAAMAPGLLDRAALAPGDPRPLDVVFESMMRDGIDKVSPNGVLGDQRAADAARGERYLAAMAHYLVNDFRKQRGQGVGPRA